MCNNKKVPNAWITKIRLLAASFVFFYSPVLIADKALPANCRLVLLRKFESSGEDRYALLRLLEANTLTTERDPNFRSRVSALALEWDIFSVKNENTMVAFAALARQEVSPLLAKTPHSKRPVFYFPSAATDPAMAQQGLYTQVSTERLNAVIASDFSNMIVVRTQNPRVYSTTNHLLESFKKEGKIKGYKLVVKKILREFYLGGELLTREVQTSNDPEAQNLFKEIDPHKGDAFVLAWEIEK